MNRMNRVNDTIRGLIDLVKWKRKQVIFAAGFFFLLGTTSVIMFYKNMELIVLTIAFIAGTFSAVIGTFFVYILFPPFPDTGTK